MQSPDAPDPLQNRDTGALENSPCPCGTGGPRLVHLGGKKIACFLLPDETLFSPTFFNDMFSMFPLVSDFQIAQRTRARYGVTVGSCALVRHQTMG